MADETIFRGAFSKLDEDQRLVFGWASVVSKAGSDAPLVDLQDDILDLDSLETAVYAYVIESRDADEMHKRTGVGTLVESVILTPSKIAKMGLDPATVPVGWWVGFFISDDTTWEGIKNGTYKSFSIAGSGEREAVAA
jgi:hypothetical protein